MAQRLKNEVRERILAAALTVFAADGYRSAKMADIAQTAGISAGNLYRYFGGKEALFHAVIDPQFVDRFDRLLDRRVRALSNLGRGGTKEDASTAAEELLGFWIEHRLAVVVVLDRCEGSRYEGFGERFVQRLVSMTTEHLEGLRPDAPLSPLVPFTLTNIFHTSLRSVVSILETYSTEDETRAAFEAFWSFQLAGLAGFEQWVRP